MGRTPIAAVRPLELRTRMEWLHLDFVEDVIDLATFERSVEALMVSGLDEERCLPPLSQTPAQPAPDIEIRGW